MVSEGIPILAGNRTDRENIGDATDPRVEYNECSGLRMLVL